ncbi:hypothetical protein DFH08DRAFT_1089785 [Mycena albidolilacea]|uniref:Uncharacterized protein n=1 Tax=Mycena albidolilacea TaxID=1033008 RepID=A0AAD7E818_9AGAR|nr:hypothetical protein DFH08DRAFT_1089785 [Mycena albidolilacea]
MPSWSSPYHPIPQDEKVSESGSASDLLEAHNDRQTSREKWLGRILVCIAAGNLLVALATVIATRDIYKLRIPSPGWIFQRFPDRTHMSG